MNTLGLRSGMTVAAVTAVALIGGSSSLSGQTGKFHDRDCPVVTVDPCEVDPCEVDPCEVAPPSSQSSAPVEASPPVESNRPVTSQPVEGGGFSNVDLFSGSTSQSSFAARAPGSYIDSAVIANMFRFRFDAAYNNPLPDRAEFLYGGPGNGPLLIAGEDDVDYQEFSPYLERALSKNFSLFVEMPFRLIDPSTFDHSGGPSDLNLGFKSLLYSYDQSLLTAQFRVYTPTGAVDRGLGTGNVALEPGLLYFGQRTDRLIVQSEFRVWVPLSDTVNPNNGRNFSGTVLRYGAGFGYDIWNLDTCRQRRRLATTFEAVGWTLTGGFASDPDNVNQFINVSGDTIINLKSGLRYTAGVHSLAGAYGFNVTDDRWYSDIFRVEYRYCF